MVNQSFIEFLGNMCQKMQKCSFLGDKLTLSTKIDDRIFKIFFQG